MKKRAIAIVPSAGIGRRFGSEEKKTFTEVQGIPVLIHTLRNLQSVEPIEEIIPVLKEEDREHGYELIKIHNLHKVKRIAKGGKERQDSVYNALKLINNYDGFIVIHDGVRPLITPAFVEGILHEAGYDHGVVPGLPVRETIKKVDSERNVISTVNRSNVWSIQTPQIFPFSMIKEAYDMANKEGFYATDDAALVERAGRKIKIVKGSFWNIKITTPEDIYFVEMVIKQKILSLGFAEKDK
jgi:2-C-methyl-D-erythritol 4-phosphate cytidylyltransferase